MMSQSDERLREVTRRFKNLSDSELKSRKPDFSKIDNAAKDMISEMVGEIKEKCDSYSQKFISDNPELGKLKGDAKDYLDVALNLDYLGKTMGVDFKNEVLLNVLRSAESLLKGHMNDGAELMFLDSVTCSEVHERLSSMKFNRRLAITPTPGYVYNLFSEKTKQSNDQLKTIKGVAIGQYITLSGKWPKITHKYSGNWDVKKLNVDPDEFINAALDLTNIRNKVVHETADEVWKEDQVPYVYSCLKTLTKAF